MFYKGSRYEEVDSAVYTDENGQKIWYKKVRFIEDTPAYFEHTVKEGERLDLISQEYYFDPEKFWFICDANNVMDPQELEVPGKRVLIPPDEF